MATRFGNTISVSKTETAKDLHYEGGQTKSFMTWETLHKAIKTFNAVEYNGFDRDYKGFVITDEGLELIVDEKT